MNAINDSLSSMSTVLLTELDDKLMNRIDTKFILLKNDFLQIINQLTNDYNILSINNQVQNNYNTVYYDTSDFKLYNQHHVGKLNRHKVRERTYLNTGEQFVEVKLKNNNNRTIKARIKNDENCAGIETDSIIRFLKNQLPFNPNQLRPTVTVNHTRITLINKKLTERLTFDFNLSLNHNTETCNYHNIVIAELKQSKKVNSIFSTLMLNYRFKPKSVSKYCLGVMSLYPSVKKNNFKQLYLHINKLNQS